MVEEKGKQAEERQDEPRLWRPWRPPRSRMRWRVLWAVGMLAAVETTALLIAALRHEIWKDLLERRVLLGFSLTAIVVLLAIAGARRSWTGFQGKTVWDFLQLLIVPLMLVAIGFWFTAQQDARQQQIATQRAQNEALQAYLDHMSTLLLDRDLRSSTEDNATQESKEARTLARAQTLTELERVDSSRKSQVLQFLDEANLIRSVNGKDPIVALSRADLSGADLGGAFMNDAHLSDANLRDAFLRYAHLHDAHLHDAHLDRADLSNAFLSGADLSGANLTQANLAEADLSDANLRDAFSDGADLRADLSGADLGDATLIDADLSYADLRGADLSDAQLSYSNLSGSNLSDADLSDAYLDRVDLREARGWTEEQLRAAKSLEGATMPNGQKYEDWLKSRKEDGENG